jgi:two-component system OmpR family sensor kinase
MSSIMAGSRRRRTPTPEQSRIARTQWLITMRISVVILMIVTLVEIIVYFVVMFAQHADADRETQWAVRYDTVAGPPGCVWMMVEHDGVVSRTRGTPAGLPVLSSMTAVRDGATAQVLQRVREGSGAFTVRTARRGVEVVQAAYDEKYQAADLRYLLLALGTAELLGLLPVALASGMLARRAMTPLSEALGRQQRFVADASHELRTPLTQLHTRAQLLSRRLGTASPEQVADEVTRLVNGTRQLGDVIDDLLMSAQLSSSSPISREPVDLAVLAEEAVAAEDARAEAMGVRLQVRSSPGHHLVMGTPSALRRVVATLVDNAMGHTPPGGRVMVRVRTPRPGIVSLSVCDTGVGFAPEEAERIFQRFARGGVGRGRRFGLGLALAREVIDSHAGRIVASGRPGHGALFTVELPAAHTALTSPAGVGPGRRHRCLRRARLARTRRSTPARYDARADRRPFV